MEISVKEGGLADFSSHRIEGFARMGNKAFSAPLFSHIEGNLWQGGCPEIVAPTDVDHIVNLYPWGGYDIHDGQTQLVVRMYDEDGAPPKRMLDLIAAHIKACVKDGVTLVHCQAGLNRSALVTAYYLIKEGFSPEDAISLLRQNRCEAVLCNESFERYLLQCR